MGVVYREDEENVRNWESGIAKWPTLSVSVRGVTFSSQIVESIDQRENAEMVAGCIIYHESVMR